MTVSMTDTDAIGECARGQHMQVTKHINQHLGDDNGIL